jgi:MoaA/NifB/PqqE/SkfB family radical SAM enzyme
MPFELAKSIVDNAKLKGIESITLLGGEPTLFSNIIDLINYIVENKIELRIVTNGQKSFQKLISKLSSESLRKLHICFSIDGSNKVIHDNIRGKNTFLNLTNSILLAISKNISLSGITSISKDNYDDLLQIINLCSNYKMKYLNIHYVTDRGFAKRNKIVDIDNWLKLSDSLKSINANIPLRFEKTYVSKSEVINCEVNRKKNIIIDPKGNVYGCTMFMNFKNTQSAIWTENGLVMNNNLTNENNVCAETRNGCPAMTLVNEEIVSNAKFNNLKFDCIFNKTSIVN